MVPHWRGKIIAVRNISYLGVIPLPVDRIVKLFSRKSVLQLHFPLLLQGSLNYPFMGDQCKYMVVLRDFPKIKVHEVWVGFI